jgi:hypothetical protein
VARDCAGAVPNNYVESNVKTKFRAMKEKEVRYAKSDTTFCTICPGLRKLVPMPNRS